MKIIRIVLAVVGFYCLLQLTHFNYSLHDDGEVQRKSVIVGVQDSPLFEYQKTINRKDNSSSFKSGLNVWSKSGAYLLALICCIELFVLCGKWSKKSEGPNTNEETSPATH